MASVKRDRRAVTELVDRHYPVIAPKLLRPLLDLCRLSRRACGGDMDKFLIMLVVGIRTMEHGGFGRLKQEQLLSGEIPVFPTLGTNVRSISESVGVPRETVRRKVIELIKTGWIVREGNELRFTARAYQDLVEVRAAIELLAVRNFEAISALLDASED